MKLSKAAKARIKMMSQAERKKALAAAELLAMNNMISYKRYETIHRTLGSTAAKLFKL